ncbi:MAG: hypothetical protein UFP03_07180 [Paludibacteraceae bacterium]|jgi:hypothetical protein|nr:hypothetical protein [Paludibacteraceae bacterium]
MITPATLTNTTNIALEKERLRKAIDAQERVVLRCMENAKQQTSQQLSPINLLKNSVSTLFSVGTIRRNPVTAFQLGYKLVSCIVKKAKDRKKK